MNRVTLAAAMMLCCAGGALAQSEKSCCAKKAEKAETVAQTVATEAKDEACAEKAACPVTGTAQTVAQTDGKQCSGEAQAAVTQVAQTEAGGSCCPAKGEGAAQQVAEGKNCQTACSDAGQVAAACSTGKLAALAADLPAIERKVGDEVTRCPVKAGEWSQASGQPVMYLVGQQSFEDESAATRAYATELTSYLDKTTRVTFAVDGECIPCPEAASKACSEGKQMTYRVAGRDFESAEAAVRAAAMAYAASRQVNLDYIVDGECAGSCEKTAQEKSMATAEPVVYRVGETETKCDVQASVMLAIARIEAAASAVQALPQS